MRIQDMNFAPPLSKEENNALLTKALSGDPEARDEFFTRNMRLIAHVVSKFRSTGMSEEDRFSAGQYGFLKAYNSFDPTKDIQFATYAIRCMENEILMNLRNNKKKHHMHAISLDDPLAIDIDDNELTLIDLLSDGSEHAYDKYIQHDALRNALEEFNKKADENTRKVIHMRFVEEMTQRDIAKVLGITQSYTSRLEQRAIEKLQVIMQRQMKDPIPKIIHKEVMHEIIPEVEQEEVIKVKKARTRDMSKINKVKWFMENTNLKNPEIAKLLEVNTTTVVNYKAFIKYNPERYQTDESAHELYKQYAIEKGIEEVTKDMKLQPGHKEAAPTTLSDSVISDPKEKIIVQRPAVAPPALVINASAFTLSMENSDLESLTHALTLAKAVFKSGKKYNFDIVVKEAN